MSQSAQTRFRIYMNWLNMSAVLNIPDSAIGPEYALMYGNMSKCAKILNYD